MANKNENKLKVLEVKIVKTKSVNVKARADIKFEGFLVKGFKVLQDLETKKNYVKPPSYQAGSYWRPLFITDSESDWKEICRRILEVYGEFLIRETLDEIEN